MPRFRKRPIVVEAWRWLFSPEQEPEPQWVRDRLNQWPALGGIAFEPEHPTGPRLLIASREGVMTAIPGCWIIKGVKDEVYPCDEAIFAETYEAVD